MPVPPIVTPTQSAGGSSGGFYPQIEATTDSEKKSVEDPTPVDILALVQARKMEDEIIMLELKEMAKKIKVEEEAKKKIIQ